MKLYFCSNAAKDRLHSGFLRVITPSLLTAVFICVPASAAAPSVVPVTSCGTVINQPGNYALANDLFCFLQDGIAIIADNVTLSLSGHNIAQDVDDFGFSNNGISVGVGVLKGNKRVTIMGPGTISGFNQGINFEQVTLSTVSSVTVTQNFQGFVINGGFAVGCDQSCPSTKNTFQGNISNFNDQHGFTMTGADSNTFKGNTTNNNVHGHGILLFIGSGNTISDNTSNNNGDGGITVVSSSQTNNNAILRNSATGNARFDLIDTAADCTVNNWKNNTFGTASLACIQ